MNRCPQISVILPSFGGAKYAFDSVATLRQEFDRAGLSHEIIVVDDGGGDFPTGCWEGDQRVQLLRIGVNKGKGRAVVLGMREARGRVRAYTDVDLPYGVEPLLAAHRYIESAAFHMVIGDRNLAGSRYGKVIGFPRRVLSTVASTFVGVMVTGGIFDTQCGLKVVRGDVAEHLFGLITIDRFAFDVELVYLALHFGLDVKRIPVRLRDNNTSTVRPLRDSLEGARDILRIKWNQTTGRYGHRVLRELAYQEYRQAVAEVLGENKTLIQR